AEGVGAGAYTFTHSLGNKLWLLSVDIWLMNKSLTEVIDGAFYIRTGQGEITNVETIRDKWTNVIPMYKGDIEGFTYVGPREHFHWDMMVLYQEKERRFGIVLENFSATVEFTAISTFQISEG
ncbi:unnamed protein product, partial [marine sediment metagenome]